MRTDAKLAGANERRRSLRVLVVEDSELDAALLVRALERGGFEATSKVVDTAEAMCQALEQRKWDLILADHAMPQFSAPEALDLVKKKGIDVPFIIFSGHIDEATAVAAMRAGAHDYVMKERLARLVPAVERELREAEVRHAQRRSEEELRRAHEELELRVEKRTSDLKAAYLKLQNLLEERRRLETELLEIAENERKRIGFDLHDDLGQRLTGLMLMLKGLERKLATDDHPCAADAQKVLSLVEDVIEHTHNLAHHVSSLDVRGDDLSSVLKSLAGNVKKMFDLSCKFHVKGAIPALPEHTTMQLYKIAQESVSNAIKHGKAKSVAIALSRNRQRLIMTVKNDGLPFTAGAQQKNRMGLRIMNFRANTIGASLEIEPDCDSGTIVTCELPVNNGARVARGATGLRRQTSNEPVTEL